MLGICTVQRWTDCLPGTDLCHVLHDYGHGIPKGRAPMAVDWFEIRRQPPAPDYQRKLRAPITVETRATPMIARPYHVT